MYSHFLQTEKEIENFFNCHASTWDTHTTPELLQAIETLLDRVHLNERDIIVDVGCGTGILVPYLRQRTNNKSTLIEIDLSPQMVYIGSTKFSYPDCLWTVVDTHFLPLTDECVDTVICFAVFPHLINKSQALAEHHRVLKPGGQWVMCHTRSSQEINKFHRQIGGVVQSHLIPPYTEMESLLTQAHMTIIHFQDTASGYLLIAKK